MDSQILSPSSIPEQCSSAFLLYPGGTGTQTPRNKYLSPPTPPFGFSAGRISVFAEGPDMVFPIGQAAGYSNITQHQEYFPVSVDILAAKGCDGLLVRLAQDLVKAGIIQMPVTGQTIYGGDILTKRQADEQGLQHIRYIG